ncbi:acetate/propionate family kinase [Nitrosospira multiformis]|uniref:Acetate kinase n=1 Tax=Nitrosospira multiformis TaxID=1231 RepID=A0A1I7G299_9PROT|nr:acetate/propionate family kinase [Nitrosospira multiformis]SFU42585.1 acetate kinase [Nitrosospira multiformis]
MRSDQVFAMKILTVNTGSSSVRLSAFVRHAEKLTELASVREDSGGKPEDTLQEFVQTHKLAKVNVVVHRVVHGGRRFISPCLIDRDVEREIERLAPLAPLHNPVALKWICGASGVFGAHTPQVAVFDTAFFTHLPTVAQTYAIPHELTEKYALRRYGFHGLAHQAMWQAWRDQHPDLLQNGKIISMQLGAGCSITATDKGLPRDTSMGFSPLEGLMMATRSGDLDPGLMTFLQRQESLTPEEMDRLLNEQSGLSGVSGISADIRKLLKSEDERKRLAIDLYCYRARKYLGAYLAVLGGTNAVVFGGGVGENVPVVREKILAGMEWCGIHLDAKKNSDASGMSCISSETSKVEVWVVPVNEAAILAQEAEAVISSRR